MRYTHNSQASPAAPKVRVKVPSARKRTSSGVVTKSSGSSVRRSGSSVRSIVEFILFLVWLLCTGIAGYFLGYSPSNPDCPDAPQQASVVVRKKNCTTEKLQPLTGNVPLVKEGGFTVDELKTMWKCSHAEADDNEVNKQIFPDDMNLQRTKWKSIITVEPKAFFDKYLTQYPGDIRAVQPVIVFSHKPLNKFEEIADVCKVLDVAIVPDKPGVCVAVTETYHDVASYHMLHADRQKDGTFALTSNSLEGRTIPSEANYAAARALLLDFFKHGEAVMKAVQDCPRYSKGRVAVASIVEDSDDLELFLNTVASAGKIGTSKTKFCAFTTQQKIKDDMEKTGIRLIYMPELAEVGTSGEANVGPRVRRYFLQAWFAFAVANSLNKMMWAPPGTVFFERPDNVVNAYPIVEALWAFRGREDKRAAPFFNSFEFFVILGTERPIHLLHEILLHFDLVIAWDSLDAVAAYRLAENNSRYGTTTYLIPPFKVVNNALVGNDPAKIRDAVQSADPPYIVYVSRDVPASAAKKLLSESGLWYV